MMDYDPAIYVGRTVMIRILVKRDAARRSRISSECYHLYAWVKIVDCTETDFTALHSNGRTSIHTWDEAKAWGKP